MCTRGGRVFVSNVPGVHAHDATHAWKPQHSILRAKAGGGIASGEFGRPQAVRDTVNVKLRRAGAAGRQGIQLIARYGHQALVGGEPDPLRIILQHLYDGLLQRAAGALSE